MRRSETLNKGWLFIGPNKKEIPVEWINEARTDMLPAFLTYARPLIQAELTPIYINGLTQHIVEA